MYKSVLKTYLGNETLNRQLQDKSLVEIAIEVLPGKYSSMHNNKISNLDLNFINIVTFFVKVFYLITKCYIRSRTYSNLESKRFDFLLFVPNQKFTSYFNLLDKELHGKKMVVSLEDLDINDCINLRKFIPNRFKASNAFSICLLAYSISVIRKKKEFKLLINNLELLQKLIYNIIILDYLFRNILFRNYFSLLPNIDHHYIIETYFSQFFENTYAIRATATDLSDEHKYIKTKNLFYKSILEKSIYEQILIVKNINLLEASLLIELKQKEFKREYPKNPQNIVFLDTCLMKNHKCNISRERAIEKFYDFFRNQGGTLVSHKFHPGLSLKERKSFKKKYPNIHIIEDNDQDYVFKFDLIVGFYSTVFQLAIMNRVPIIMISNYFNTSQENFYSSFFDLSNAPIINLKTANEMNKVFSAIFYRAESFTSFLKTEELYEFYARLYNYPVGLQKMFKTLNG